MKITFKCCIETPTEEIIEEYTLDDAETQKYLALSAAERERWKDDWAETAFLNACSYGTDVVEEP